MKCFRVVSCLLILFLAYPAGAVEQRGELILIKAPLLEIDTFHREPVCESFLDFRRGENQPNFFNYRDNNCQGRYSFTLRGEAGSTVTLFGKVNYGRERGYLVVRKTDPELIWVDNLEDIPPNQWVTREAQGRYGAYEAFFAPAPQFSQNIASVQWGQWWKSGKELPASGGDRRLPQ